MTYKDFKKTCKTYAKSLDLQITFKKGKKKEFNNMAEEEKYSTLVDIISGLDSLASHRRDATSDEFELPDSDTLETSEESKFLGKSIVEEILEERGSRYGEFDDAADLSQALKSLFDMHVQTRGNPELFTNPINEAIEMIFHKLARIGNGDPTYVDNFDDIAGYAQLASKSLRK